MKYECNVVVCGPAIGKTYLAEHDCRFIDLDEIKATYKYGLYDATKEEKERGKLNRGKVINDDSLEYAIKILKQGIKENRIVLLSYNNELLRYLIDNDIKYCLVYAGIDLASEYAERMRKRGNTSLFVDKMTNKEVWEKYYIDNKNDLNPTYKVELKSGQYLWDIKDNFGGIVKKEMLKIKNLTKYYGKVLGVKDLSFTLNEGEIFGFIGPNGAGKSTTIRCIMNLVNKTSGTILFDGKEFDKGDVLLKEMIGYLPSEIHLYEDLTVGQMLDYHESFYKKDIHNRRVELVKRLKLDESRKVEDLSLGNSKKLGIVLAFMHEPKLLILDEPTSGLDPIMQQIFYELLKEEKDRGATIFYSTHILSEVSKICDYVGIIKEGELLKIETMEELQNKNLTFVTIESGDNEKIVNDLGLDVSVSDNMIRFKNTLSFDLLIKSLSKYKIDKILIEEATLEDMFLHYYR